MRISVKAVLLLAAILMVVGCSVGKTSTMFMTKTNAGLELSSAPPTVAFDISRVEGVLGPQFENGKKLPVLASFKFENTGAFAPYLGSTFATGDAAVALAALYGDETTPKFWKDRLTQVGTIVDSRLELNHKPDPGSWFSFQKVRTGNNGSDTEVDVKPVFFGTDTMLGVKIAWSTMTGTVPDSAKLGYNRKEFALLPIAMTENGSNDKKFEVKMASLLATLDSPIDANTGKPSLDSRYIQYFATGNAATLLALQQDVRRAMLARLDPNQGSFLREFGKGLGKSQEFVLPYTLSALYNTLTSLEAIGDEIAKDHRKRLNDLVADLRIPSTFTEKNLMRYRYVKPKLIRYQNDTPPYSSTKGFYRVIRYWSDLDASLRAIETAKKEMKGSALECDPKEACSTLERDLERLEEARNEIVTAVRTNREIIAAYSYFQTLISP